jgi:hypothetical protein
VSILETQDNKTSLNSQLNATSNQQEKPKSFSTTLSTDRVQSPNKKKSRKLKLERYDYTYTLHSELEEMSLGSDVCEQDNMLGVKERLPSVHRHTTPLQVGASLLDDSLDEFSLPTEAQPDLGARKLLQAIQREARTTDVTTTHPCIG